MKSLITYASSGDESDDNDHSQPQPTSESAVLIKPADVSSLPAHHEYETSGTDEAVHSAQDLRSHPSMLSSGLQSGALSDQFVGPARPTSNYEQYSEYQEHGVVQGSLPDMPDMPESDLRRYLTQPSYPISGLPSEPLQRHVDSTINDKVHHFLRLKSKGLHLNQDLAQKSSFNNPNLFASLLQKSDLSPNLQYSFALPSHILDLESLPAWTTKDQLFALHQNLHSQFEAVRASQSSSGNRVIDFTPALGGRNLSCQVKRKRPKS